MHKPILIIKTGTTISELKASGQDFEHWFCAGFGLTSDDCVVVALDLGESLPALHTVSGIVITGSAAYVTDEAPWNFIGARYLAKAHAESLPILGICYGHQLLAWTFGGEVDFHPQGREIGTVSIQKTKQAGSDRLFANLPESFLANASHQQSVLKLPVGAVRLASNKFDENHAFRLGSSTWGIQFHPEFDGEITAAYVDARWDVIESEGLNAAAIASSISDTPESKTLLTRFLEVVRER